MIKISSSNNHLRIVQLLILILPLALILSINIITKNYLIFTKIGFLIFLLIYLAALIATIKLFLFDWDLYKNNNYIVLKNLFGNKEIIDIDHIDVIKIHKTMLSVSFYFKIQINSKIYTVRYFPEKDIFKSYTNKHIVMQDLENVLKHTQLLP